MSYPSFENFEEPSRNNHDRFQISRFLSKTKSVIQEDVVFCANHRDHFLICRSEHVLNCYTLIYIDKEGYIDENLLLTPEEEKIFTYEMKKLISLNGVYYLTRKQYEKIIFPHLRESIYT